MHIKVTKMGATRPPMSWLHVIHLKRVQISRARNVSVFLGVWVGKIYFDEITHNYDQTSLWSSFDHLIMLIDFVQVDNVWLLKAM